MPGLEEEIQTAAPWFEGDGDPVALLQQSLAELVQVSYESDPTLRAVSVPAQCRLVSRWCL